MIDCTPTGASTIGAASSVSSTFVRRSRAETSRSIRGSSRQRRNASRFSRWVSSVPAPPKT
jgi:hypothetical protein